MPDEEEASCRIQLAMEADRSGDNPAYCGEFRVKLGNPRAGNGPGYFFFSGQVSTWRSASSFARRVA